MVHLSNLKMLANTIRHKSSSNYDIDDFIKQLLASQKFDELAEKVADKAVSKIRDIEGSPKRLERFIGENKLNKSEDAQQNNYREQSSRDYDKESNLFDNNIKLRNDHLSGKEGKIDTQAVMDETTSLSENLKLKYKYLTRNAYEKKVFNDRASDNVDRNSVPTNDKKDISIQNVKKSPDEFTEHDSKPDHISNQDITEKSQHGSKNDFDDDNRWRQDSRDVRKESDSNRESNKHSYIHDDRDDDRNKNINNKDHSNDDSWHEQKPSREVQNSRPEFKSVIKSQVDKKGDLENGTTEDERETPSSIDEDHSDNSVSSPEKTQENIQEDPKESGSGENVEEEEPAPQFRAQEESYPNVEENKVASLDKNQEDHRLTDEHQNPDNSSKKPIIRREGDKLFTFVEAPEYAEYHEEMAKLIKDKEISPADFLVI